MILLLMLVIIFYKPERWLKGNARLLHQKMDWKMFVVFLLIGIYAGFLHVAVGYLLLGGLVLLQGYDLLRANAQKNFLVLIYSPFVLGFFIFSEHLTWEMATYGSVHAIGNVIGATLATRYGMKWGNNFIRWLILVVIILTALNLFGIIDLSAIANLRR